MLVKFILIILTTIGIVGWGIPAIGHAIFIYKLNKFPDCGEKK